MPKIENPLTDPFKDRNGFTTVSVDSELIDSMANDITNELVKNPDRKKISYREMIATYRGAWLREQNTADTTQ